MPWSSWGCMLIRCDERDLTLGWRNVTILIDDVKKMMRSRTLRQQLSHSEKGRGPPVIDVLSASLRFAVSVENNWSVPCTCAQWAMEQISGNNFLCYFLSVFKVGQGNHSDFLVVSLELSAGAIELPEPDTASTMENLKLRCFYRPCHPPYPSPVKEPEHAEHEMGRSPYRRLGALQNQGKLKHRQSRLAKK